MQPYFKLLQFSGHHMQDYLHGALTSQDHFSVNAYTTSPNNEVGRTHGIITNAHLGGPVGIVSWIGATEIRLGGCRICHPSPYFPIAPQLVQAALSSVWQLRVPQSIH